MQVFRTKTGLINVVISLLMVLMVAFLFVPSVTYEPGTEDEGTVSVYGYVFQPTEKPYKSVTKYFENEIDPEYDINDVYADPMLLMVLAVVAILICFAGYKHWISSVMPVIWGVIGIKACAANTLILQSSWLYVYMGIAIAVVLLAAINFALNTAFKKKAA